MQFKFKVVKGKIKKKKNIKKLYVLQNHEKKKKNQEMQRARSSFLELQASWKAKNYLIKHQ